MHGRGTSARSVRWLVGDLPAPELAKVGWLRDQLTGCGWVEVGSADSPSLVVVWHQQPLADKLRREVCLLAAAGSRVLLCGPSLAAVERGTDLADATGILVGRWTPPHEVRVQPGSPTAWKALGFRPAEAVLSDERVLTVEKVVDDVEVLFTANVSLCDHPVATYRQATRTATLTLCGGGGDRQATPEFLRLLLLTIERSFADAHHPPPDDLGVGLLGYGAIGAEHSRALAAIPGLALAGVCDRSEARLAEARTIAPDVATMTDAGMLLARDDVQLVVVSTPPDSHARWALQALEAGKHVIVEKPFALSTAEADAVLASAKDKGLLAVVYQNRRFDPDYLAIKEIVTRNEIGSVFRVETFIGGFAHPCNYWHSDERVSGGAIFDWGAHVLDQLLDLIPTDIDYVTGTEHKLVWHDVSNADHSRVTVRFVDGSEVEFTHSDIAAALKPRWYVLGTQGAIVGEWRTASVIARSEIGTLDEDAMAPADSPPTLSLHHATGSVTQVVTRPAPAYTFHQQLADYFQLGIPMTVSGAQSRRVLAVMEAARASAMSGGHPVSPL